MEINPKVGNVLCDDVNRTSNKSEKEIKLEILEKLFKKKGYITSIIKWCLNFGITLLGDQYYFLQVV